MNIVIITGAYYPYRSPESNCIDKFVQDLVKDNCVDIISPLCSLNSSPVLVDNLRIHFVTNWWNKARIICSERIKQRGNVLLWRFFLYIIRLYGVIISQFTFPSRHSWQKKHFLDELTRIGNEKQIDVIISVMGLPCAHLAVLPFKQNHPETIWITYSLDPYTFFPSLYKNVMFKSYRRRRNYVTEAKIYGLSNYNIFTEELVKIAKDDFCLPKEKITCFPYVLTDFGIDNKHNISNSGKKIVVLYAGALNKKIRNPSVVLSLFSSIPEVQLQLYVSGDCGDILDKYRQNNNIEIRGLLPREDYVKTILYDADILINIGNSTQLQAPSKFFELLSTGRPIINFYYKEDVCFDKIELYPYGINVSIIQPQHDDVKKIRYFCLRMKGLRLSYDEVSKLYPENRIEGQLVTLKRMMCINNQSSQNERDKQYD